MILYKLGVERMTGFLKKAVCTAIMVASMAYVNVFAAQMPSGEEVCFENFENTGIFANAEIIKEANGNSAMYISNEFTDVLYTPPQNTVVEGSFKVLSAGENAVFEISTQSGTQNGDYFGGMCHNLFSVDIKRGFTVIDKTLGPDVEIHNGYNTFKITNVGATACFEVNGKKVCTEIAINTAALRFRAENCEILVDNVKISSIPNRGATMTSLVAQKPVHTVSAYEPCEFLKGSGLVALYSSDTRANPVSTSLVQYRVDGDYKELSDGYGYFYGDSIVTFTYKGFSCKVQVKVDNKGMTKGEYLSETIYKRRQEMAYTAYYTLNNTGFKKSTASYSRLFELLSAPYLYPTSQSHEEIIDLFLTMAEETKFETRGSVGAEDFIALDLILLRGNESLNISDGLKARIDNFFKGLDLSDPEEVLSENHRMTYYAIAIAVFEQYGDAVFFNGLGAEKNKQIYKKYILDWIDFRLKYGMGEYDSPGYYTIDFAALETIYTKTKDAELKKRVYEMLMYIYADAAMDSNNAVLGGALSRTYINSLNSCQIPALDVIFDNYIYPDKGSTLQSMPLCYSEFVPQKSLIELRADPQESYVNIEKRRMYTIPDDPVLMGSVTKYAYVNPKYIIGSLVKSDNLPAESFKKGDKYYVNTGTFSAATRVLPDFQALGFSISIGGNAMLNIIDSHPGTDYTVLNGAHSYFAGDHGCHCARYGQSEHTVLGIRHITDEKLPQFSHFYLNKNEFDEVVEEKGWIMVRKGGAYAAIKPVDLNAPDKETAYEWGNEAELFAKTPLSQLEVKINSTDTAFVAEAYSEEEIGDFLDFVEKILTLEVKYEGNKLTYTNIAGDTLVLDYSTGTMRKNGKVQTYASGNGYVSSAWGNNSVSYDGFETPYENYVNVYKKGLDSYKVMPLNNEGQLFVAIYDNNGRIKSVERQTNKEVAEYSGARVKALLWENVNNIKPIIPQSY